MISISFAQFCADYIRFRLRNDQHALAFVVSEQLNLCLESSVRLEMFSKIVILACALAMSNAGYLAPATVAGEYTLQTAALTSTSDNILRSTGNLAQIATQSKTISTPFSSSSKSDIRVTNPGIYAHAAPLAYAATHAAAPLATSIAAEHPTSLLGVAYSPAVAVSHMAYSSPIGVSYSW
ncbi:Pupal cuticle protein C1B [Anthophora retusa]